MKYITLNDLNRTIRKNIYKIPRDIDFIIAIPRSGMIVGSIISEFLNVPLIDIDNFCNGANPTGGNRLTLLHKEKTNKALVIDDTIYSGSSMIKAKNKLKGLEYEFIYGVAYLEGIKGKEHVDFYLEDVIRFTKNFPNVLYEWNVFHHYPHIMSRCMYDIDGVFCLEPPDENFKEIYEDYIQHAKPLFIPSVPIGRIVTYRLIKYSDYTKKWLEDNGIVYGELTMFNAQSWKERNDTGVSPEQFKAYMYANDANSILFIESNDWQAAEIYRMTKKPVLCVETNKLYGNEL